MKRLTKNALLFLGAIILGGRLYAQPGPPATPAPVEPAVNQARMTPSQMKEESQAMRERVRLDLQRVQHQQTKARKANDIIKLTCVNDKFVKLKAHANLFDNAHRELLGVIDTDARFGAYEQLSQTASNVQKAREEADTCIGEPELAGVSANDFTSPDIVDDPTLALPFDIEVEPPAYASPYI
jgi:hypothetical protein